MTHARSETLQVPSEWRRALPGGASDPTLSNRSHVPLPGRLWRPLQRRHAIHSNTVCPTPRMHLTDSLSLPVKALGLVLLVAAATIAAARLLLCLCHSIACVLAREATEPSSFSCPSFSCLFSFCPACRPLLNTIRHHPLQQEPCLFSFSSSCRRCRCLSSSCPWHPHQQTEQEVATSRTTRSSMGSDSEWPATSRECLRGAGALCASQRVRRQEPQKLAAETVFSSCASASLKAKQSSHPFNLQVS